MNDYYKCGELNELDDNILNNSYVPTCTPSTVKSDNDIGIIVFLGFMAFRKSVFNVLSP